MTGLEKMVEYLEKEYQVWRGRYYKSFLIGDSECQALTEVYIDKARQLLAEEQVNPRHECVSNGIDEMMIEKIEPKPQAEGLLPGETLIDRVSKCACHCWACREDIAILKKYEATK